MGCRGLMPNPKMKMPWPAGPSFAWHWQRIRWLNGRVSDGRAAKGESFGFQVARQFLRQRRLCGDVIRALAMWLQRGAIHIFP